MRTQAIELVTSVNRVYFERYGRRMVETFLEHTDPEVTMRLYHEASREGVPPSAYAIGDGSGRVTPVDLFQSTGVAAYLERVRPLVESKLGCPVLDDPDARRAQPGYHYLWDAVTFGRKGWTLVHALESSKARYCFWIDADVVFLSPLPAERLLALFDDTADVVFFGRHREHSETGLIGFDLQSPGVEQLRAAMARLWDRVTTSGLDGWTDSHVFDRAREELAAQGRIRPRDLARHRDGHVMASSELSPYLDHLKGARKLTGHSPERRDYLDHRWRWTLGRGLERLRVTEMWRNLRHR